MELTGKHLLLGLTGSIACYKSAELTRLLKKRGADVQVVMTPTAAQFITPITMQALSGQPVYAEESRQQHAANNMLHISACRQAQAIIIAPTSANFIAKLAQGQADDLLSALCVARACPLIIVPAMNQHMWHNPAVQRNIAQLAADGVRVWGPATGAQACGDMGEGRMLEPDAIVDALIAHFQPKCLSDKGVLLTAGPTFEPIDPIRGITNRSSGKMGFAVARAARDAGAQVTLIAGPSTLPTPPGLVRHDVQTAQQMFDAVMQVLDQARMDIFIAVAAVSDWRVNQSDLKKIKKDRRGTPIQLHFVENPDILASVARLPYRPFCVGFAVESDDLETRAQEKRQRKSIPLVVGNTPDAFGSDDNTLVLFDENGITRLPRTSKQAAARLLVAEIAQRLNP